MFGYNKERIEAIEDYIRNHKKAIDELQEKVSLLEFKLSTPPSYKVGQKEKDLICTGVYVNKGNSYHRHYWVYRFTDTKTGHTTTKF